MFYSSLKKGLTILIVGSCLLATVSAKPLQVVAVTEDFASITKSIAGDLVQVIPLVKGSRNLHNIKPKPSMVLNVRKADLLIRLGMDQDSWIDGLIQTARKKSLFPGGSGYLDASLNIDKLEVPHGHIDGSMGDVHAHGNPHYWLSPENGKIIAKDITERLIQLDPDNQGKYEQGYADFVTEMDKSIVVWKKALAPLKDYSIISYHKVWAYFFDAFDLKSAGELEPLPGVPPTTRQLAHLKEISHQNKGKVLIMSANFYPKSVGLAFAKDIGAPYRSVVTNVGAEGITEYKGLFDYLVNELSL